MRPRAASTGPRRRSGSSGSTSATRSTRRDVLRFNPDDDPTAGTSTAPRRAGEFDLYDEYDPRRAIFFNATGDDLGLHGAHTERTHLHGERRSHRDFPYTVLPQQHDQRRPGSRSAASRSRPNGNCTAPGVRQRTDGNDVVFGDLGNDWLVGGTGHDTLWGGWGNDLLQADDELARRLPCLDAERHVHADRRSRGSTTRPTRIRCYEDRAFGGAGRDILIGNTGGDRLIDWVGEFNSYLVPFAPFGIATVSRQVPPALFEFLYALSRRRAPTRRAPPTTNIATPRRATASRTARSASSPSRTTASGRTRPAARRPAGRATSRAASATCSAAPTSTTARCSGFAPDSGVWEVTGGALQVAAASLGKDAAAVFYVDQYLPIYYEIAGADPSVRSRPPAGRRNAYLIFDYFSPTDFKFAGIDVAINKIVIGHRDGERLGRRRAGRRHRQRQVGHVLRPAGRSSTASSVTVLVNGVAVLT